MGKRKNYIAKRLNTGNMFSQSEIHFKMVQSKVNLVGESEKKASYLLTAKKKIEGC